MRTEFAAGGESGRYPAGSLRWIGTGPPLLFLVVLSLAELLLFDRLLPRGLSTLLTLLLAAVGILAYGFHVSRLMEGAERQILAMYEEAAEQNRQLHALHEAGLAITSNLSLETVLERVLDLSLAITGAGSGAVAVYDARGETQRLVTRGRRSPLEAPEMFALPLRYGQTPVGMLYLADRAQGVFGPREESAARKLSAHAAVAVMNARLHEEAARAAILEERHRLSMDLHDGVLQELYGIALRAEDMLAGLPPGGGDEGLRERLEALVEAVDRLEGAIRRTVQDLREGLPRPVPPAEAVEQAVRALDLDGRLEMEVQLDRELGELPGEQAETLRFVVREALANVLRHARARRVHLELARQERWLRMEVRDDGVGFRPGSAEGSEAEPGAASHHGLANMRRRAERAGGRLEVESAPGRGTRLVLLLPATPAARR